MCTTCGCNGMGATVSGPDGEHTHVAADGTVVTHRHDGGGHTHVHAGPANSRGFDTPAVDGHGHTHGHSNAADNVVKLEQRILLKNDHIAQHNREFFADSHIAAVNLMSSPGAGKTTLLEYTLKRLSGSATVLEGDQETSHDAQRIRATGARAVQINTGTGCHLDADMVRQGIAQLEPEPSSILFIENVGNLVCPALFDLGETARVVLFSVTEGEDKPLKYPHMFRQADLVLLTKTDLLPHLRFDVGAALDAVERIRPGVSMLRVSTQSGEGTDAWMSWLEHCLSHLKDGTSLVAKREPGLGRQALSERS